MSTPRQLHLNAFLMTTGHHEASWRLPESDPHAGTDLAHFTHLARTAERGCWIRYSSLTVRRYRAMLPADRPVS